MKWLIKTVSVPPREESVELPDGAIPVFYNPPTYYGGTSSVRPYTEFPGSLTYMVPEKELKK